jgi:endo-beta-N-acetylglucosaminidase D
MPDDAIPLPGAPTIKALESLSELLGWQTPTDPVSLASVAQVPRANRPPFAGPASMVGFDCGPWQYDPYFTEWSQGGTGSSVTRTAANVYNFSFWQYLDISYYIGHQVVIIPPTVWTNAAHANGVSSLGTLNLNNEDVSKYNVQLVAAQLIKIAQFYQFDGYLINDENYYGEQEKNWDLQLMTLLRTNQAKPLTVIWYDAPVSGGYANELNSDAVPFLQAAGYFHTNYCWGNANSIANPQNSFQVLKQKFPTDYLEWRNKVFSALGPYCDSNSCAGCEQPTQPYSGYFFENYELISDPNLDYLTGIGVYAPDFTMYWCLNSTDAKLPDMMTFQNNDQAFWAGTTDYINYKPDCDKPGQRVTPKPNQSMAHYIQPRTVIVATPFVTDFNTGEGSFFNLAGANAARNPWNNLSVQSILPTWRYEQTGSAKFQIVFSYDQAFIGGSSLLMSQAAMALGAGGTVKLYQTELMLTATNQIILTALNTGNSYLPTLQMALYLDGAATPQFLPSTTRSTLNGWTTLFYAVPVKLAGYKLSAVGVHLINDSGFVQPIALALGQLKILDTTQTGPTPMVRTFPPAETISWKNTYDERSSYRVYGLSAGRIYLLGIVRNYVYSTRGNILNTGKTAFTQYYVQEVDRFGVSSPIEGISAGDPGGSLGGHC